MTDGKNYKIVNLVASGGTAVLYKAIQTSLDRTVAVKQLHDHLTEDENFTRRFILEAKAAASLDHENIVKIIDFGVEDGSYLMVMEFIEGESYRDILDRWKQIPEPLALAVVYQICMGLEHAHAKGIIHRDIKPGNIMLTQTGRVKITDFGLAKLAQATTQHTAANSILGTPLYMSPEQAFGESVDTRSDLFSLGTILYESLTGHQPFVDENYMGVIQNIIHQNAPHPSKFNVELSPPVESIILKSMNKNRDGRFQSAKEMKRAIENHLGLEALREASEGLKSLLVTDGATMVLPKTERARKKVSRFRAGIAAALVMAVVGAVAALGYVVSPDTVRGYIDEVTAIAGRAPTSESPAQSADLSAMGSMGPYADPFVPDSGATLVAAIPDEQAVVESLAATLLERAPATKIDSSASATVQPVTLMIDSSATNAPSAAEPTDAALSLNREPSEADPPVATVKTGWLSVRTEPTAEIYVDGTYIGDAATSRLKLTSGSHTLECRRPNYDTYRETLNITTGELSTRHVILERLVGRISLLTTDGAEVIVDGVLIGVTPLDGPLELDAGQHQLTVKKAGYHVWNNLITLEVDQTLPLKITLSPIY